jgi:hypothetical protein
MTGGVAASGGHAGESPARPPWTCPRCGRTFANPNQTHTCAPPGSLEDHFARAEAHLRATFNRIQEAVEALGPVTVLPKKSRIAFQVRMSFAAVTLRRRWLDGHVVLARCLDSPRFCRIEAFSPRNVLHSFRLTGPDEVDAEVRAWLAEAYRVGEQRHLTRPPDDRRARPPGLRSDRGALAQLAEQRTFNPRVLGSIPRRPTADQPPDLRFCRNQ